MSSYIFSHVVAYIRWITGTWTPEDGSSSTLNFQGRNTGECRFRLDTDSSAVLVLPDQRKLGYAQYGSPTGRVLFTLHGLPGSRLEAAYWDKIAQRLDGRIIAVDRPGYGWSSPHPNRALLDHAKDIRCLAKHLGIKEYVVMGVSGGGPYALSCAASLPADELKSVAVVCGLGPPDIGTRGMNFLNSLGFTVGYRYFPGLTRWFFARQPAGRLDMDDDRRLELTLHQFANSRLHERDAELLKDEDRMVDFFRVFVRNARDAYGQGFEAVAEDGRLMSMDWGFRIEDIRPDLPVQLWYGKYDDSVPLNHGQQIAKRLGDGGNLHVKDETHLSLVMNCMNEILEDLFQKM